MQVQTEEEREGRQGLANHRQLPERPKAHATAFRTLQDAALNQGVPKVASLQEGTAWLTILWANVSQLSFLLDLFPIKRQLIIKRDHQSIVTQITWSRGAISKNLGPSLFL